MYTHEPAMALWNKSLQRSDIHVGAGVKAALAILLQNLPFTAEHLAQQAPLAATGACEALSSCLSFLGASIFPLGYPRAL